jgi:anaerobic selenocysteine-containing dehydrogenase
VAAIWGLCQTAFLTYPESVRRAGYADGEALFEAVVAQRSGVVFTVDDYDETLARLDTTDKRVNLVIDELVDELRSLATAPLDDPSGDYPYVLSAGERRSSTANTIYRDPSWMKKDGAGALRIHPGDAAEVGVDDGGRVRVTTKRGSVVATVELNDTLRRGHISLPNGRGLDYPDTDGEREQAGIAPNELTSTDDRDWLAGTPWHKHVRAKLEVVG